MVVSHPSLRTQILVVAGLILVTVLLLLFRPEPESELRIREPARVAVTSVRAQDLLPVETVSGRLEPARRAVLRFEVAGRVERRHVEPGTAVSAGDALVALAAGDMRDALTEAEAQLAMEQQNIERDQKLLDLAKENAELARAEVKRIERLGQQSLSSRSQLDLARRTLLQLQSELAALQASIDSAASRLSLKTAVRDRRARDLARAVLVAPFDGMVNAVLLEVGDYAMVNQAAVELVDVARLDLLVAVRGDVAQALALGQEIPLTVDGRPVTGHVHALQPSPDPSTFTHAVRIRLQDAGAQAGAVAHAELAATPLRNVLTVPVTAVLREDGQAYVFRVADDVLQRMKVKLGASVGEQVAILDGLAASDRVVSRDVAALSDGEAVSEGQ